MEFKTLTMDVAAKEFQLWQQNPLQEKALGRADAKLKRQLVEAHKQINSKKLYQIDIEFGFALYRILNEHGFTVRDAANDDIWRYLSIYIVPELVAKRWSKVAEKRFFKESNRIWLKTIWWYIHLSWQGTEEETRKIIENNSTDQIMQLVDRSGRKGYFIETFRWIMRYYYKAKQLDKSIGDDQFRSVMKVHTALCQTVEPDLFTGGAEEYVKHLFQFVNIKV